MTRYARANNCQKKKPEDATPWKELASADSNDGNTKVSAKRKLEQSDAPKPAKKKRQQGRNFRGKKSSRDDANDSNGWNQHRAAIAQKTDGRDTEATTGGGEKTTVSEGAIKREKLDVSRNRELRFGGNFGSKFEDSPRQSNAKVCFNCRQRGHMLADCPTAQARDRSRLCFKCGSTDHDIKQCPVTSNDMPFATCFVCKNTGHLSRNCPDNANGVYIRGGECRGCGSKTHLYTQCPTFKKNTDPESMPLYVDRVSAFEGSVDLEATGPKKKLLVKPQSKIVKF